MVSASNPYLVAYNMPVLTSYKYNSRQSINPQAFKTSAYYLFRDYRYVSTLLISLTGTTNLLSFADSWLINESLVKQAAKVFNETWQHSESFLKSIAVHVFDTWHNSEFFNAQIPSVSNLITWFYRRIIGRR